MEVVYSTYQKGILLKLSNNISVDLIDSLRFRNVENISIEDGMLWCGEKKSRIVPTKFLSKKILESQNGWYTYKVYLLLICDHIYISCPNPKLLEEVVNSINSYNPIFRACNLRELCNLKFYNVNTDFIYIRRINAQILGEESNKATSISLFGQNILKSDIIKRVLKYDKNKNEIEANPIFGLQQKTFKPNSIKLTFDDGTENRNEEFSLNTDKFGNFSYFLRSFEDLNKLHKIFKLLFSYNLFSQDLSVSPLKRSDEALNFME